MLRLRHQYETFQFRTRNVRLETRNVRFETRNVRLATRNVRLETRNVGLETRNVGLETRNVRLETRNVRLETRNVRLETRNVGLETRTMVFISEAMSTTMLRLHLPLSFKLNFVMSDRFFTPSPVPSFPPLPTSTYSRRIRMTNQITLQPTATLRQ
ncbi:hypothetical protein NIES2111_37540 [Nostoc sp. NIES-2111]|nr:hypothetical protein NIES2111_37540 [Nostoc sp. NIES-2111]